MDFPTVAGLLIALLAILGGQALEGGHIGSVLQPTAAIIVFGGTIGAVSVQFPGKVLKRTLRDLRIAFRPNDSGIALIVHTITRLAAKARREGLISIERDIEGLVDPFFRRGGELVVDGTDSKVLRSTLELELSKVEDELFGPSKVLEACGGYAPTVGILGAVMGLIHVMENLSDPSKLGGGIAVAFVATVYGVGFANLIALPLAGKLKARAKERVLEMELIVEGLASLAEGENPRLIERKLSVFIEESGVDGVRTEGVATRAAGA